MAQRTSHLRFGPLVMLLNLYHPLRAFEEICMLDQWPDVHPRSARRNMACRGHP
jgi:hypothetical protein